MRPWLAIAVTGMASVAFALVVYFVSSSVAFFATNPSSDPVFGRLNHCLLQALPTHRVGFTVSPQGRSVASFTGSELAVCELPDDASAEALASLRQFGLSGVTALAFDFANTLWVSTAGDGAQTGKLWRIVPGEPPERAGDVAPVALVGHQHGVVALDASGKLMSIGRDGEPLAVTELPRAPVEPQLAVDAEGEVVSIVSGGGVWMFSAKDLALIRGQSPCDVGYLWWLDQPAQALVSCDPDASWALTLNARTGVSEAAVPQERPRSTLVPRRAVYVQGCDALPCQAPSP